MKMSTVSSVPTSTGYPFLNKSGANPPPARPTSTIDLINVTATSGFNYDFSIADFGASILQLQGFSGAVSSFIAIQNPPTPASEVGDFTSNPVTNGTCLTP
jgi:hypothetical protein